MFSLNLIPGAKTISRTRLPAWRGTQPTSPRAQSTGPPNRKEKRMRMRMRTRTARQSQAPRDYLGLPATARMETRKRAPPPKVAIKRRRRKRAESIRGARGADLRTGMHRGLHGVLQSMSGGGEGHTATMTATIASRAPPSATERPSSKLMDTS